MMPRMPAGWDDRLECAEMSHFIFLQSAWHWCRRGGVQGDCCFLARPDARAEPVPFVWNHRERSVRPLRPDETENTDLKMLRLSV